MSTNEVSEKEANAAAKKEAAEKAKAAKQAEREAKAAAKNEANAKLKAEKEAAKAAKLAAKEAAKAEKEAGKTQNTMPEQNGIRRPKPGSVTGNLWEIFDSISEKNNAPATIAESLETARNRKINDATTRTQYARWRSFNGISGRLTPAVVKAA